MRSMPFSNWTLASRSSTIRIRAFRMSAWLTINFVRASLSGPASRAGEFQRGVERMHELVDPDGLGQIAEEARLQTFFDIAGHGVGAEGHHGNVGGGRIVAQDAQGFDAADAG